MTRAQQATAVVRVGLATTVAGTAVVLYRWWRRERDDVEPDLKRDHSFSHIESRPIESRPTSCTTTPLLRPHEPPSVSQRPAEVGAPKVASSPSADPALPPAASPRAALKLELPKAEAETTSSWSQRPRISTEELSTELEADSVSCMSEATCASTCSFSEATSPTSRWGTEWPEVEPFEWAGAKEVRRLADNARRQAIIYFDDSGSRWQSSSSEDGVHISSLPKPNSRLPIFRGLIDIPADKAPCIDDLAQVMLSYSCRRFYEELFEKSAVLADCGNGTGLMCSFFKPSHLAGRSFSVGAFSAQRRTATSSTSGQVRPDTGIRERVTVAIGAVPERLVEPFSDRLSEISGDQATSRSDSKLWALDALLREDGSVRVGFLIHNDGALKMPTALLRKMASSAPAEPLTQIVMMASVGMTPQHTVALAGPEPEETEDCLIGQRTMHVSTLFRGIFSKDAAAALS